MKVSVFFLITLLSFSVFSASSSQKSIDLSLGELNKINGQLLQQVDEQGIDELLENKAQVLDKLVNQLKVSGNFQLLTADNSKKLDLLESRINLNKERGNNLAVQRDKIELATNRVNLETRQYLNYLIDASKTYQSIESIVEKSQQLLDQSRNRESALILPKLAQEGSVFLGFKKNQHGFLQANNSYQDILSFVVNNPRKIASVHWFQEFSLISAISYINNFDFVQPINYKLTLFNVDTGGIIISFVIIFLIYFSYPFVFKCTSWCVETFIIDTKIEQQETIYHEIRRPARTLLVFFGINIAAHAFLYKTDYRASLAGFSYVIYSFLFIWLFFKIIDCIVLVQIEKLSTSNKELRRGLFNLGVQTVKGIIVVIVLTFGLSHFGISLTAIVSTLGVGGLAFALAAKDTLSNLFGGITILFDNVFRMGDWVKVGDVEGTVADIGLRSTTIRTFDNALITIPNSQVSVSSVRNWNRRAVGRRIKLYIGVTYECEMDDLRQALVEIRAMLKEHPDIANPGYKHKGKGKKFKFISQEDTQGIKSTQLVFMDRYSDFSIDILIYCFARTIVWSEWLAVKEDVLFKIADILKKNNLEFAYPTQVRINRTENNEEMRIPPQFNGFNDEKQGAE